jgi:hypothetical protein
MEPGAIEVRVRHCRCLHVQTNKPSPSRGRGRRNKPTLDHNHKLTTKPTPPLIRGLMRMRERHRLALGPRPPLDPFGNGSEAVAMLQ